MKRLRRLFAYVFILSIFVGALHELSHTHQHGEACEVCILAHTPALADNSPVVIRIEHCFEPFASPRITQPVLSSIFSRSRSPPLV